MFPINLHFVFLSQNFDEQLTLYKSWHLHLLALPCFVLSYFIWSQLILYYHSCSNIEKYFRTILLLPCSYLQIQLRIIIIINTAESQHTDSEVFIFFSSNFSFVKFDFFSHLNAFENIFFTLQYVLLNIWISNSSVALPVSPSKWVEKS